MPEFTPLSTNAQLVDYLKRLIHQGEWVARVPGEAALAKRLSVDPKLIRRAMLELESAGILVSQGKRKRRIVAPHADLSLKDLGGLRIAIMGPGFTQRRSQGLGDLPYGLSAAGHRVFFANQPNYKINGNDRVLTKIVGETVADAWIIFSGPRPVLEWFAAAKIPVFSVWGRHHGLPISSTEPDRTAAYAELTRKLLEFGHRRIVLMSKHRRRLPTPGPNEQAYLNALSEAGIRPSSFHLPDWQETCEGYQQQLNQYFRLTPPTAILIDDASLIAPTIQFLNQRGLRIPQDVSLACTEHDLSLEWMKPRATHIRWNRETEIKHALRWVRQLKKHGLKPRNYITPAELVPGETIGPVPNINYS